MSASPASTPSRAARDGNASGGAHPADRIAARVRAVGAATCVGLDPVVERLPASLAPSDRGCAGAAAESIERFSLGVIEAVSGCAAAVKIQAACFERFGADGFAAMSRVLRAAQASGLVVVYDAKRGDIGISAEHYAASARALGADWTTVNAYLGADGLTPFLADGGAAFALVRTSNPSGDILQGARLEDGRTVAETVADLVAAVGRGSLGGCGYSALGAVVGATKRAEIAALRARMPQTIFLVPGYGAQGGTAEDVRAAFTQGDEGALITASRSVIYPQSSEGADWKSAVATAARTFAEEIRAIAAGGR